MFKLFNDLQQVPNFFKKENIFCKSMGAIGCVLVVLHVTLSFLIKYQQTLINIIINNINNSMKSAHDLPLSFTLKSDKKECDAFYAETECKHNTIILQKSLANKTQLSQEKDYQYIKRQEQLCALSGECDNLKKELHDTIGNFDLCIEQFDQYESKQKQIISDLLSKKRNIEGRIDRLLVFQDKEIAEQRALQHARELASSMTQNVSSFKDAVDKILQK